MHSREELARRTKADLIEMIRNGQAAESMVTAHIAGVLKQALDSLEEIEREGWRINTECLMDDCHICPQRREAQNRALKAIEALKKELAK